jgi:hypothetical protein|tara:strand:+ start:222 stop:332 length:111 start_codon:yes stop_codon:yes gene_type:complete
VEELKHFDKVIKAEDVMSGGCLDNCKCKQLKLDKED